MNEKKRIHTIDEVRGLCVVGMVLYHALYTITIVFNFELGFNITSSIFMFIVYFGACTFIFISGIASQLTSSNLTRGIKLIFVAILISVITSIATPQSAVYFGIIHFFSVAMIVFHFIKPLIDKINIFAGLITSVILFILTFNVTSMRIIGIPNLFEIKLPDQLYQTNFLFAFGFPNSSFMSADYFPLLPFLFMFIAGGFVGRWAVSGKFPNFLYKKRLPPLSFVGRHSLIIYVLHQPVIFGIMMLITSF